jgi:hypothetical protein
MAMAVEAAARIHNEFLESVPIRGFLIRDVKFKKSLTIPEDDYGVEVLTSMELVDTATAQSPAWAAFSISSVGRESNEWVEHITGFVRIDIEDTSTNEDGRRRRLDKVEQVEHVERQADARAGYEAFLNVGLGYGPTFQPLSDIRTDPEKHLAVAQLSLNSTSNTVKGGESTYPLHPASLDGAVQLGLIACHGGRHDDASTAFVPFQLAHMYLSANAGDISGDSCTVVARGEQRGIRGAHLDLQMLGPKGEVILKVGSLRCVSYSRAAALLDRSFSSLFSRLAGSPIYAR